MGRRRGAGEGAVYRRKSDGLFCAAITVGYDANGKRKRRVVSSRTKGETLRKLAALQAAAYTGTLADPVTMSIGTFLSRWLHDVARTRVRESTFIRYESLLKIHVLPHIGGLRLKSVQPPQIQALYSKLEELGASPRTREFVHAVLHVAFDQAVRWRYVVRNTCDAVDRPRVPRREMSVWSEQEVCSFLAAARNDRLHALYVMALTTTLRQGELFALVWDDIDLQRGTVSVQRTQQELKRKIIVAEPKTRKGRRVVDLPKIAVEALKAHRAQMLAEGHPHDLVFCDTQGGPLRRSNVIQRSFETLIKAAGVCRIRFHDMRHTGATLLLRQGVHPKVVQERLGHATISLTLDTYSHVLPSMQKDAAGKLDAILGG